MLSPIVLFVYNRPWHTRQTIEALKKNELASDSELFIYSDAPKNDAVIASVREVREYIRAIDGFKKVTIIERERNYGLAANIIDGVISIVSQCGRVIVLEDDLVTSPVFLRFMNEALEFYKEEKRVWHISGYMLPIRCSLPASTFFSKVMFCWGWATWQDRWMYFERDPEKLMEKFTRRMRRDFNLDGSHNFFYQIKANYKRTLDTWAVFWYATIYLNDGLCLNPTQSLVKNIGLDGSGEHKVKTQVHDIELPAQYHFQFETRIQESLYFRKAMVDFYNSVKPSVLSMIYSAALNRLRRLAGAFSTTKPIL